MANSGLVTSSDSFTQSGGDPTYYLGVCRLLQNDLPHKSHVNSIGRSSGQSRKGLGSDSGSSEVFCPMLSAWLCRVVG